MAGTAERQALKKAALLALEESRGALGGEVLRVRTDWNPKELVRQTVARHKIALAVTAAVVGLGVTRFLMMPRKESGRGSSLRRRLTGLAATTLWSMFQEPILEFAKAHLTSYLGKQSEFPIQKHPNE